MKHLFVVCVLFFLCACAGNPPQWWNPSGAYGSDGKENNASSPARPSLSSVVTAEEEEPYPMEQTIEPAVESYEELNLSPLGAPQEAGEILPETSAAAAAQEPAGTEETAELSLEQTDVEAPSSVPEEEYLPPDGSLPPPSVLQ